MLDYYLVFGGQSADKLDVIYTDLNINIFPKDFLKLYDDATDKRHNFLYIDVVDEKFRKNFTHEYDITEMQKEFTNSKKS